MGNHVLMNSESRRKPQSGMSGQVSDAVIRRAQSGNAAAIAKIYEHYQANIYRFFYYRLGDEATAEDLTAETFLRMVKALPKFERTKAPFQAWIFRIARNLAVDHYRKMAITDHLKLTEDLVYTDEDLETAAERSLTSEYLVEALDKLTLEQREVIILRFVVRMRISEVAQIIDKSETAVKALQRRGLLALKNILGDWGVSYG